VGKADGRLRWEQRNLLAHDWSAGLADGSFDVVLSSTALHWLTPPQLAGVYRQLAAIVRPGGIVLNGDHMPFDRSQPSLARLTSALGRRQEKRAFEHHGTEDWRRWWDGLQAIPALAELLAERNRLLGDDARNAAAGPWQRGDDESHCSTRRFAGAALLEAGFAEVGTIWQELDDYILLAVR
jgi:SAM-dependent methyltransferase